MKKIYIFTNLLSTSIHGYQEKRKKTPGTRDKNNSNHRPGKKRKNIIEQKKRRKGQLRHTSWKRSRDMQSVGQKKNKTHRKRCNATITRVLNMRGANYNQLWCIDVLTPPHLLKSLTDSLPFLNLLGHSKTDARFMQDAPKAVWSIPYVSMAFFPSLKQNFIAYRSSKVSSRLDCMYEIQQLRKSGFSRVYSNSCCSCSFEPEIIKIGQLSHQIFKSLRQF